MTDGPPPPPPPPPAEDEPPADARAYTDHLARAGKPTSRIGEDRYLGAGGWRMFYRTDDDGRHDLAAVSADGRIVLPDGEGPWFEFLTADGMDAAGALRRVAWLMGRPAPVDTRHDWKDPAVAAAVSDPSLERNGDEVVLEGWVVYPPEMQSPFAITVRAPRGSDATLDVRRWNQVGS